MKSASRIANRFPSVYKTWDEHSLIYKFLNAFAKGFDEGQKDIRRILRSHWIDTARGSDLDRLGAIFNLPRTPGQLDADYRDRIKNAIQEFRGGGTAKAVIATVRGLLGLTDGEEIELVENPPQKVKIEKMVRAGDVWTMTSRSIHDVKPTIRLKVIEEEAEASHPTLQNLATGETLRFAGILKTGQELVIKEGKASLDEVDVTKKLKAPEVSKVEEELAPVLTYNLRETVPATDAPTLTRRPTDWQYTEALREKIGVFNIGHFDEAIFAVGIPQISLQLEWTAHAPASFEVHIPKSALARTGIDVKRVQRSIDFVKAAGVTATLKMEK